jgi:hypothetical protein
MAQALGSVSQIVPVSCTEIMCRPVTPIRTAFADQATGAAPKMETLPGGRGAVHKATDEANTCSALGAQVLQVAPFKSPVNIGQITDFCCKPPSPKNAKLKKGLTADQKIEPAIADQPARVQPVKAGRTSR